MSNLILVHFSAISPRIHTVISYTSAITEAHYIVLALTNSDWLLWQNTHTEKGQEPVELCLYLFSTHQNGHNHVQPWEGVKAKFT
jgi:hypothetical protein